jgi:ribose transport system permease protein
MSAVTETPALRPRGELNLGWTDIGPFLALAALLAIGFVINPDFLSATNLSNVITRSAFIAIIAVGATFVISSGGLDLSVGSMAAFITGITIMFMNALAEFRRMVDPAGYAHRSWRWRLLRPGKWSDRHCR